MVELDAGDMLFFHCRLFHAAGRNETETLKCSLVFSYHDADNQRDPAHPLGGLSIDSVARVKRRWTKMTRCFEAAMSDVARLDAAQTAEAAHAADA